jgi:hypothetical protein
VSASGAIAGGFVGTLVLTSGLRAASELRLTRMDLPFLLGTVFRLVAKRHSPLPETPPAPATTPDATPADEDDPADSPTAELFAFTATTVQGEDFDGAEYAGRDVALWFWAPW